MQTWFIDCYRSKNKLVVWLKDALGKNIRREVPYVSYLYAEQDKYILSALKRRSAKFTQTKKETLLEGTKELLEIEVPTLDTYERYIKGLERDTLHKTPLYNADIPPEEHFMFTRNLFCGCQVTDTLQRIKIQSPCPAFSQTTLSVTTTSPIRLFPNAKIRTITLGNKIFRGKEYDLLRKFYNALTAKDPDIMYCEDAFRIIPYLSKKFRTYGFENPFNRWDQKMLRYRGGKSFHSYGQTVYRDFAVRLNGRFLVDTFASVVQYSDTEGILELCQLSGGRFQTVASRSHGSVFQTALKGEILRGNTLIPRKQKPLPLPISMYDFVKADRAGHTFDAQIGFHKNIVELDFSCLFPQLMVDKNISAEKLSTTTGIQAPGTALYLKQEEGFLPKALRPFVERRKYHKRNKTSLNRKRSEALKGVLVSANGYLRFREFKLGQASTHVALCAYARECILTAKILAEQRGFTIIHGIIDSVYLAKESGSQKDIEDLMRDIKHETGIDIDHEGVFKWIVFLPSVNNPNRPVPMRYFGAFQSGGVKIRGIEARQKSTSPLIKEFQKTVLEKLSTYNTQSGLLQELPLIIKKVQQILKTLHTIPFEVLACKITITKERYKVNNIQNKILRELKKHQIPVLAGRSHKYVFTINGPELLHKVTSLPDTEAYKQLFIRSIHSIYVGLGVSKKEIEKLVEVKETLLPYLKTPKKQVVQL